jgi:transposase
MSGTQNSKIIIAWVKRINRNRMSVGKYFSRHNVPFSIAQYYRYKKKLEHGGPDAIKDNRSKGNNRKLVTEAEGFLKGYLRSRPEVGLAELQDLLKERFKIRMSKSGVSRCLNRLGCVCQMKPGLRRKQNDPTQ